MPREEECVYVVGVSMTHFARPGRGGGYIAMGRAAAAAALQDAGLPFAAVNAAVCSYCYGASTCGQAVLAGLGRTGLPVFNTNNNCASGGAALQLAAAVARQHGTVLCLGFEEMDPGLQDPFPKKHSPTAQQFAQMRTLGVPYGPLMKGMNAFTSDIIKLFAYAARQYAANHAVPATLWAEVASKNRRHGDQNPKASLYGQKVPSANACAKRGVLCDPVSIGMSAGTGDGAAACVLMTESTLRQLPPDAQLRAVKLSGIAMVSDTEEATSTSLFNLSGYAVAKAAAARAFQQSGVRPAQCGVVELHDCFSPNEVFMYDALGLSEGEGKGGELFMSGLWRTNTAGGRLFKLADKWVVNPSGGLLSKGHPLGATGLAQCYEVVTQLRGEAGLRQVEPVPLHGLQHNYGFNGGAVVAVYSRFDLVASALYRIPRPLSSAELAAAAPYAKGWCSLTQDIDMVVSNGTDLHLEGVIPSDLCGTFFRNGPGLREVYGHPLAHPIDGDGLVLRLAFRGDGTVDIKSRFVDTKTHRKECEAQRILYPGMMGTRVPEAVDKDGKKAKRVPKGVFRDPAHTNVFEWGGRLLACHEYLLPWRMDPVTLETVGNETLNGTLKHSLAAHFRYDQTQDRLVCFGFRAGIPLIKRPSSFQILEVTRGWVVAREHQISVPGLNYVHDLAVTPTFYIVQMTPFVRTDKESLAKVVSGEAFPGEQMACSADLPCRLVFINRITGTVQQYDMRQKVHIYHFGHAREVVDDACSPKAVHIDAVCLPANMRMQWQHELFLSNVNDAPGLFYHMTVDVADPAKTVSMDLADSVSTEFPTVHPNLHVNSVKDAEEGPRFTYLMCNDGGMRLPFQHIVKHDRLLRDRQSYLAEGCTLGEPIFAPRVGSVAEDDGYVIVQAFHPGRGSEFHILDARRLEDGPVCKIKMRVSIPYGFHGTWSHGVFAKPAAARL
eukprot:TRINITY_DN1400_c0_g1_i1.p1 TRINITY_DN1400_c0_g1~~TRINITY_DN1400_c0_g1_i1.p1  ORF type:complete len:948 (+),score=172.17 TRINITY_DN1400_c0_g1_i1:54-2897(+)